MDVEEQQAQKKAPFEWQPQQYPEREINDYRCAKQGPKGYKERTKRKLEEMGAQHVLDQEEIAGRMDDGQQEQPAEQASKRRKSEGVPFIPVSGRTWKLRSTKAADVMKPKLAVSWEKKMAAKAAREQFQEVKKAAQENAKSKRKAVAQQKREALQRKEENKKKSEVTQKVTNSATLKKMMKNKKQKKTLRKADTN